MWIFVDIWYILKIINLTTRSCNMNKSVRQNEIFKMVKSKQTCTIAELANVAFLAQGSHRTTAIGIGVKTR